MKSSIAARRIGWVALALFCAGAQANAMAADMKESRGMPQNLPADFNTMRPIRNPQRMEITVGQGEGDLQGKDDKVIQAAMDYVFRLGGGTVRVLPGHVHDAQLPSSSGRASRCAGPATRPS